MRRTLINEVFDLTIIGKSTKEISEILNRTEITVRRYQCMLYKKYNVSNKYDFLMKFMKGQIND